MILNIKKILQALPHRYPFVMVDRILEFDKKSGIIGLKNVTFGESFFQGHFPGEPIMPGVMILEGLAQTSALFCYLDSANGEGNVGKLGFFRGIEKVKFTKKVIPGDILYYKMKPINQRRNLYIFSGYAFRDNDEKDIVTRATLSFVI